jgi:hypothetical protein
MLSVAQPVATPVLPDLERLLAQVAQFHSTTTPRELASETALTTRPLGTGTKAAYPSDGDQVEPQDLPARTATQALISSTVSGPGTEGTGAGVDHLDCGWAASPRRWTCTPHRLPSPYRPAGLGHSSATDKPVSDFPGYERALRGCSLSRSCGFMPGTRAFAGHRVPRAPIRENSARSTSQTNSFSTFTAGMETLHTLIEALAQIHHAASSTYPSQPT